MPPTNDEVKVVSRLQSLKCSGNPTNLAYKLTYIIANPPITNVHRQTMERLLGMQLNTDQIDLERDGTVNQL